MSFLKIKKLNNSGYTIIETMVAVSIFVVIIISGMSAIFNANLVSHKSEDIRSIVDNINFIMEDMARSLRTGYNFHCINSTNGGFTNLDTPMSCDLGGGIAFEEANGDPLNPNDQWVYVIDSSDGGVTFNIKKSTDGGATYVQLNPSQVILYSTVGQGVSGFRVLGAESPDAVPSNTQQPLAVIRLVGEIVYRNTNSPFSLQTAVSQRFVDVAS